MTVVPSLSSAHFYIRYVWFNLREQFSDVPSALAANALVPFFVWMISSVWNRFNSHLGNFTFPEIVVYVGLAEVLYMTFIRMASISRASADFSTALARPRSWLLTSFFGLIGRSLGARIFMLAILLATFPLLGAPFLLSISASLRLLVLLPWLAVLQGLCALLFANAQVLWHQTNYFLMPVGKIFLVLGGVLGPVADFAEPWRSWILLMPPSDLFFQPAYFCIKGQFYGISPQEWLLRTVVLAGLLTVINLNFFRFARQRHLAYGG